MNLLAKKCHHYLIQRASRIAILLCLLIISYEIDSQQQLEIRNIGITDGLSQSSVLCMIQDKVGFVWIGTRSGMNRYDGSGFKIYKNDYRDSLSLSNSHINALFESHDGRILIATKTGFNIFDPVTQKFKRFFDTPQTSLNDNSANISTVFEDSEHNIWVAGMNHLVRFKEFDITNYDIDLTFFLSEGLSQNTVKCIVEDNEKKLWVGHETGLHTYDILTGGVNHILGQTMGEYIVEDISVTDIVINANGRTWIGTSQKGIYLMSADLSILESLSEKFPNRLDNSKQVTALLEFKPNEMAVATKENGLFAINTLTYNTRHISSQEYYVNLSTNRLISLVNVNDKQLWVGNHAHGVDIINLEPNKFKTIRFDGYEHNAVTNLLKDRGSENMWIGFYELGLIRYNPKNGSVIHYRHDTENENISSLSGNYIWCLFQDSNQNLWVGTDNGLNQFDKKKKLFHEIDLEYDDGAIAISPKNIISITEDPNGRLLLGTIDHGIFSFDLETRNLEPFGSNSPFFNKIKEALITKISKNQEGNYLIGTRSYGLIEYNELTGKTKQYSTINKQLGNETIFDFYEDKSGVYWIATRHGFSKINPKDGTSKTYFIQDGLPENIINALVPDDDENFWLSTNFYLSFFDKTKETFVNYPADNNEYNTSSRHRNSKTGDIFFGGVNGYVQFNPGQLTLNTQIPPIVFTSCAKIDNHGIKTELKGITHKSKINLTHNDKIINFEIAALNYHRPSKNQHAYMLEGFNDDWIELGNKRDFTFTNLDAGTYTLIIKGSNDDGIWNKEGNSLIIFVAHPWWTTKWAYLIYALLTGSLLYLLYKLQLNRKIVLQEAAHYKEMDDFKTLFYTNITHEFRTPLTVISGMVDQISKNPVKWLDKGLKMIDRNTSVILDLINQILNLSKLESGKLRINLIQDDVIQYIRYILESFSSLAETKDLDLHFLCNESELFMDYDADKLMMILSNLLTNAIKFTPSGGKIYVQIEKILLNKSEILQLKVIDTGVGMDEYELSHIFDRFYESSYKNRDMAGTGYGIGLALISELTKLLNYDIRVESKLDKGTTFILSMPILRSAAFSNAKSDVSKNIVEKPEPYFFEPPTNATEENINISDKISVSPTSLVGLAKGEGISLLIMEDNADVVQYLIACLEGFSKISVAKDGQEGIEKAIAEVPDIIISDVMMPRKDGFEVCQALKTDERTSHIPIVLLTARADRDSRLSGLKRGADAYLTKPFNKTELLIILNNLVTVRRNLQSRYNSMPLVELSDDVSIQIEDSFVQKIKTVVEEHLDNESFGVIQLCKAMGLSRTQLHNKIKALTGRSTSIYIRSIRLNKAKHFINTTEMTISEIAYKVGFKDPNYFSRAFAEEFGERPSRASEK